MPLLRFDYAENTEVTVRWVDQVSARIKDAEPVLKDLGERMVNYSVPENFDRGGRPAPWAKSGRVSRNGGQTLVDSARLKNSINYDTNRTRLRVGTTVKYAALLHYGGTIKAKGKALAVPVTVSRSRRRPDQYPELQWMPGGLKGKGLLVEQTGTKRKRLIVRFVLKSEITVPARPFLVWQADDLAYAEQALVRAALGRP